MRLIDDNRSRLSGKHFSLKKIHTFIQKCSKLRTDLFLPVKYEWNRARRAIVTHLFIIIVLVFLIVRKTIFNVGRMGSFTYICIYMYIQMFSLLKKFGCWRATFKAFTSPTPKPAESCTSLRCFHKSWIDNTSNKYRFVDISVDHNIK